MTISPAQLSSILNTYRLSSSVISHEVRRGICGSSSEVNPCPPQTVQSRYSTPIFPRSSVTIPVLQHETQGARAGLYISRLKGGHVCWSCMIHLLELFCGSDRMQTPQRSTHGNQAQTFSTSLTRSLCDRHSRRLMIFLRCQRAVVIFMSADRAKSATE